MDYYQGVVIDYLRADRAIFVNPETCIQIDDGPRPERGGTHWFCDAAAIDLRHEVVFLCEITYAKELGKLVKGLREWGQSWDSVCAALVRDCEVRSHWPVRPWLFVPKDSIEGLIAS